MSYDKLSIESLSYKELSSFSYYSLPYSYFFTSTTLGLINFSIFLLFSSFSSFLYLLYLAISSEYFDVYSNISFS